MLERVKARWFGMTIPDRGERLPATTLAELTMLCDFAPPCCGHVALCDGACCDARPDAPERSRSSRRSFDRDNP